MSVYIEEMLSQLRNLDGFCQRLEQRMEIEPPLSGLELDVDDLVARIREIEANLPDGISLVGWERKANFLRLYLRKREPQHCVGDISELRTTIIPRTIERLSA